MTDFGWNLPPGVTTRDTDGPRADDDGDLCSCGRETLPTRVSPYRCLDCGEPMCDACADEFATWDTYRKRTERRCLECHAENEKPAGKP